MTYCVALLLDEGLVFASDTRTNAGVDQVAVFPKMHVFEQRDDRVIVMLTAGNLGITQSVVNRLRDAVKTGEEKNMLNVGSMFDAAALVGAEMRLAFERDAEHLKNHNAEFHASILIGGQIKGEQPRLFNVYAAGNFIEPSRETPYFQIGETKYGKPIIDRVVKARQRHDGCGEMCADFVRFHHPQQHFRRRTDRPHAIPQRQFSCRLQATHQRKRPLLRHGAAGLVRRAETGVSPAAKPGLVYLK